MNTAIANFILNIQVPHFNAQYYLNNRALMDNIPATKKSIVWINGENQIVGVTPKDEIDEFFAHKQCGRVGCDCHEQTESQ